MVPKNHTEEKVEEGISKEVLLLGAVVAGHAGEVSRVEEGAEGASRGRESTCRASSARRR